MSEPCLYIGVRKDLKMSGGKIAAQAVHASRQWYERVSKKNRASWDKSCNKTVVLKLDSELELVNVQNYCHANGIPCAVQRDAGLTQVESGTRTCIACGIVNSEFSFEFFKRFKLL